MKFTKLMALVLVLLMTVAVFAACDAHISVGGTVTTPETDPGNTPEVTTPEETTLDDNACKHKNSLKKTGNDKAATCTEEGTLSTSAPSAVALSTVRSTSLLIHTAPLRALTKTTPRRFVACVRVRLLRMLPAQL